MIGKQAQCVKDVFECLLNTSEGWESGSSGGLGGIRPQGNGEVDYRFIRRFSIHMSTWERGVCTFTELSK